MPFSGAPCAVPSCLLTTVAPLGGLKLNRLSEMAEKDTVLKPADMTALPSPLAKTCTRRGTQRCPSMATRTEPKVVTGEVGVSVSVEAWRPATTGRPETLSVGLGASFWMSAAMAVAGSRLACGAGDGDAAAPDPLGVLYRV